MILLICDDEVVPTRALVESIDWEACGISQVLVAHSAEQARGILDQNQVSLLLCDIEMPGDNGIQLLRWVKQNHPGIAFAFLTCHAEFEYARQALQLQSFDYLVKPAQYDAVFELVGNMARHVAGARQNERIKKYGEQWLQDKKQEAEQQPGQQRSPELLVKAVNDFVLANISQEITVEMLAAKVYLNPDHLNRTYKKQTGITINQYIIQERMALAARLLTTEGLSANRVAGLVGYSSYPSFVNMFKRIYGMPPAAYVEAEKNG